MITRSGGLLEHTFADARRAGLSPAGFAGVSSRGDDLRFQPTGEEPSFEAGSAFVTLAARFNYAHFLLSALPGLMTLADAGWLDRGPVFAPPLTEWRRALVERLLGSGPRVTEVEAPLVNIARLVLPGSFAALPASLDALERTRERLLGTLDAPLKGSGRVYLRSDEVPVEVEDALTTAGFEAIDAHRMSFEQQARLFAGAELAVGAPGAGFANALFMRPGARVLELQAYGSGDGWLSALASALKLDWQGLRMEGVSRGSLIATSEPVNTRVIEDLLRRIEHAD